MLHLAPGFYTVGGGVGKAAVVMEKARFGGLLRELPEPVLRPRAKCHVPRSRLQFKFVVDDKHWITAPGYPEISDKASRRVMKNICVRFDSPRELHFGPRPLLPPTCCPS